MNLGLPEIIIIALIAILLYASKHLPSISRSIGTLSSEINTIEHEVQELPPNPLMNLDADQTLTIFLSSIMNPRIENLQGERDAIKAILNHERLFSLWRFEDAPADDELEESYINKVKECHLFIIIIGAKLSDAVRKEFETAIKHRKPILVFLKADCKRDTDVDSLITSLTGIGLRYKSYTSLEFLQREVLRAVYHCVVKYYTYSLTKKTYLGFLILLKSLEDNRDLNSILNCFNHNRKINAREEQTLATLEKQILSDNSEMSLNFGKASDLELELQAKFDEAYYENRYKDCIEISKELLRLNPNPQTYLRCSYSYRYSGNDDDAILMAYKGYFKLKNKLNLTSDEQNLKKQMAEWIKFLIKDRERWAREKKVLTKMNRPAKG